MSVLCLGRSASEDRGKLTGIDSAPSLFMVVLMISAKVVMSNLRRPEMLVLARLVACLPLFYLI